MRKLLALLLTICLVIPAFPASPARAAEEPAGETRHYWITPYAFKSFGTWTLSGDWVTGRATASIPGEANGEGGEPAIAEVNITKAANYRLWVRDRDYATNQPGTRTFHVAVDGVMAAERFGDHGMEGFRWSEVGVYFLEEGVHELALVDTSGFFARSEGFFLSEDVSLVPPENKEELMKIVKPMSPFESLPPADFPAWAREDVTPVESESIENDSVKVVFHRGAGAQGDLVQNEIFVKDAGQWVSVKGKTEELGFLMMSALNSEFAGENEQFTLVEQTVIINGREVTAVAEDFFTTGVPVWFIPSDFEKVADNKIELTFPNTEADLTVTFELDALTDDPKVTLNAVFPQQGAYSFMLFSGDGVDYADYDTVTAPLLYVKKAVPQSSSMIPESYLFTPMATLHFKEHQSKVPGKQLTSGVVMDPTSVPQGYVYPDTSHFGLVLRDQARNVRPQLIAPLFGTEHSRFDSGDSYQVSYRIVNHLNSWYDTLTHVSEEMFNLRDLRTNYFHSLNEAIYNATDLMMDDDYGGWDPVNMAHYNMEERHLSTTSNAMTAVQRYLLTENEAILDERAVPTLAFLLSRLNYHFKITNSPGGGNYVANPPSPMGGPVANYSASVYGGLYEMTQGRMPFLMDTAIGSAKETGNLAGVADQAALYKYTGDPAYVAKAKASADQYLANYPNSPTNRESRFVSGFIYGDYIPMVTTFLAAYEATGEQKYLNAAEESARLLVTGLWTTGYHNGFAESDYTVDPVATAERPLVADRFTFWWHGDQQWRLGNPDGLALPPQEAGPPLQEETAPGWIIAKAGMGTEHPRTPGHGNVITMNNWAGMLVKLSEYTGDPYFETMARNAMIGRFGNYPGYYQDRPILHQMKADYPYVGPDFTSIYWHHIPVFISMLEDFLINSAWAKSDRNISFPSIYQSGYAYFASNQFGHAPGRFYDEEDMWLWLDRGIIEPDTVEIDYIAARKDGVLGLALMNEGNETVTSTIALGEKVVGGEGYVGTATVYEANGAASQIAVVDGSFTISIPAKGIRSVLLRLPGVEAPAYANPDYEYSNKAGETVSQHTRGKGHVIQISPESYHAYVYISDKDDATSKLQMTYRIGDGPSQTVENVGYPYEFLIKVDDPTKKFTYSLQATKTNGQIESLGGGTLAPNDFADGGIEFPETVYDFEAFDTTVTTKGDNATEGVIRFVVPVADFPFEVTENLLIGLRVTSEFKHKTNGSVLPFDSVIKRNEVRTNGTTVLVLYPTATVPVRNYSDYNVTLTVHPPAPLGAFDPFDVRVNFPGMNPSEGVIRLVVPVAPFPFPVTENYLKDLRITGTLTHKADGSPLALDSRIVRNEVRPDGTTVLVVLPTAEVPLKDYRDYNIDLTIHPIDLTAPTTNVELAPTTGEAEVNGWYKSPVNVSLHATDDVSGVKDTVYRLNGGEWTAYVGPFSIADDGDFMLEYYSTDNAGNSESAKTAAFRIDRTAPESTAAVAPVGEGGAGGWYAAPVQVAIAAADGGSSVTESVYRVNEGAWAVYAGPFVIADDGTYTVEYYSADAAGNVEGAKAVSFRIDMTAPEATLSADPGTIWPPNGKMVQVQATVEASDAGSGVASVSLVSIESNEPAEEGTTDVQDANFGTDDREFQLRATRLGTGDGRIYTIVYAIEDEAGNATTVTTEVRVPHHQE
ncbi:hypothetical protein FE782_27415 [Paenibacillus antri]|uniref:Uncharacterized protein n=1 Tax=Paenibacillus antri TaxID=2582848 RepID=A0A5R9G1W4_9BACL|nr:hypothetical protein [Paenibacillus antri]TLS49009.1 hypothetical protein FE782_27415 [Paenibacillus antri]